MTEPIKVRDFLASEGTEDWRVVSDGALAFFPTDTFEASVGLVDAISELNDIADNYPDIDVRRDGVTVRLVTVAPDHYGLVQRDLEVARRVSEAARELGLTADPSRIQSLLVVPGATNRAEVMPFWQAVLGYEPRLDSPDEDLVDPRDRGPAFWFEQMDEPRGDGGGAIHVAIWLPYEQAKARVEAALAAGGHLVRDDFAPAWWTLADAAGNEADISTPKQREGPES